LHLIKKWLVPKTQEGREVTLILVLPGLIMYSGRILLYIAFLNVRGPWGLFGAIIVIYCLAPIAIIVLPVLATCLVWLIWFSIVRARHPAPFVVCMLGIIGAITLPLPIALLPEPDPFPEEVIFFENREDYEHVVEMARRGELEHDDDFPSSACYVLPEELSYLAHDGRVWIYVTNRLHGLVVTFEPFDFYYPIVYLEKPGSVQETTECYHDGSVEERLDEHWFLCTLEWN
jgi:hypothetical protein